MSLVDMIFAKLQRRNNDAVHTHKITENFVSSISKTRNWLYPQCVLSTLIMEGQEEGEEFKLTESGIWGMWHCNSECTRKVCLHWTLGCNCVVWQWAFFWILLKVTNSRAVGGSWCIFNVELCLQTELTIIYKTLTSGRAAVRWLCFSFFNKNLKGVFSETLLHILITTPKTTSESERCFSTLKRIKTFLKNTMSQNRLSALAMLSIEKRLTKEIPDFNKAVIEKFAQLKERRAKFL